MESKVDRAIDPVQQRLANYAYSLRYEALTPESVQAAKLRIIDTLGALVAGFFGEPCQLARKLAASCPSAHGASVLGTRIKTAPDVAAFVNAATARYVNFTDTYHWPGSAHGHPSDVIAPVLAVGEPARASGRDFITAVVLAYEVFIRLADIFHNDGFDYTTFGCVGAAVGAGRMLGLSESEFAHCIAMAAVPNNALKQTRIGHLTTWKMAASGQSGRAGVFAAQLAQAGMEGPHLPFTGKAGWCAHVAREQFTLDTFGGGAVSFKIAESTIKTRPAVGLIIATALAAEKLAPVKSANGIDRITVEVHMKAKAASGSGAHDWNPDSPETADHSIPFIVAAALVDGTLTPRSYGNARLWDPDLRALMQKIEVIENEEYTRAYQQVPARQCARVTIMATSGERQTADVSYGKGDQSAHSSLSLVTDKFRALSEDALGAKRVNFILDRLLNLEDMGSMADLPPLFTLA